MAKTSSPVRAVGCRFPAVIAAIVTNDRRRRHNCQNVPVRRSVSETKRFCQTVAGGDRHPFTETRQAPTVAAGVTPPPDRPPSRGESTTNPRPTKPIARTTQCRGWTRSPMNAPARSVVTSGCSPMISADQPGRHAVVDRPENAAARVGAVNHRAKRSRHGAPIWARATSPATTR